MSPADLLLGSFFFIHESRSRLADDSAGPGTGPAAFEFLHNTFGEFLSADFILRKVIAEATAICALSGEAVLGNTLRQQLAMMSPGWFACLIHTPLHTRPNILALLTEWGRHRLSHGSRSRAERLKALDKIVVAQLRSIYSLNLVLLRSFLGDGAYTLDEVDLDTDPGGVRPWDRLVSIWRSWFPLESPARSHRSSPRPATSRGSRFSRRSRRCRYRIFLTYTPSTT
jgi:hypothetical protein